MSIADLITIVGILLGERPISDCAAAERDADGAIGINEAIAAVAAALGTGPDAPMVAVLLQDNVVEDNGRRGIRVDVRGPVTATGNRVT